MPLEPNVEEAIQASRPVGERLAVMEVKVNSIEKKMDWVIRGFIAAITVGITNVILGGHLPILH
jgi:hypothetical protein